MVILENRAVRAAQRAKIDRVRGIFPNLGMEDGAGVQQRCSAGLAGVVEVDREAQTSAERVEREEIVVRHSSLWSYVRSRLRNALLARAAGRNSTTKRRSRNRLGCRWPLNRLPRSGREEI